MVIYMNAKSEKKLNRDGIKYLLREFTSTFIYLAVLLISAGILGWINAWVSFGLILIYQIANMVTLHRINPSLINKRGKIIQKTTKTFDKLFVVLFILLGYIIPVIAGLDAIRFQWTDMPFSLNIIGGLFFGVACILGIWAMAVNSQFEMTVFTREGEHRVCTSGPYKVIRHPGYAAEILSLCSSALILGSWFAFIPIGALVAVFIIRTALEDRTLQQELPGYQAYTTVTRYRLIPFIW